MTTHVAEQSTNSNDNSASGTEPGVAANGSSAVSHTRTVAAECSTGTDAPDAADQIRAIRQRIDEIDNAIIGLWQERASLSQQVGAARLASGGTRLVLSRERQILDRFRTALGADGTQLALLMLRAGRGRL